MAILNREGEVVEPFATQFMEPIPPEEVLDASGHYDEQKQEWILDKNGSDSSVLMTGFNPERPPTTCQVMTKVGDKHYVSDLSVDD